MSDIIERDDAIKRIRAALRKRTGMAWSVTGGRGTAWGWLRIDAPPSERVYDFETGTQRVPEGRLGMMSAERRAALASALRLERVHPQGESIPSGGDYYREYVDRAEGRAPSVIGQPYWD